MTDIHLTELNLGPGVEAFSTCRGPEATQSDPYSGFSVCNYTGDDALHTERCRRDLCARLGLPVTHLITPRQTHSDRVLTPGRELPGAAELEGVDALVTDRRDVALAINTADCVPVVLHDPAKGVVAVAHCGWRGTVNDLLPATVKAMESLGAEPASLRVVMGPCICTECFEVGEEVAARFEAKFPGVAGIVVRHAQSRPHVNLAAAITEHLRLSGVAPCNVAGPCACTRCEPMRYFSARAVGVSSGRVLTVVRRK